MTTAGTGNARPGPPGGLAVITQPTDHAELAATTAGSGSATAATSIPTSGLQRYTSGSTIMQHSCRSVRSHRPSPRTKKR